MPFANDQYGGGGYGQQPQQGGFGQPPPQQGLRRASAAWPRRPAARQHEATVPGYGQPLPGSERAVRRFGSSRSRRLRSAAPQQGFRRRPVRAPAASAARLRAAAAAAALAAARVSRRRSSPERSQARRSADPRRAAPAAPVNLPPNALRGFLVSYQSNTQGDFWPLHGGRKTVGRANSGEQVDIPLSDATISSRHAALVVDGAAGTVQVEDTGSTNGTFVNEEHIGFNGKRDLRDGDKIRFGGFTTIVKVIARI